MSPAALSRRSVLRGGALFGVAGLAGFVVARRSDAAKATPGVANAYGLPEADVEVALARLADVPTGGGVVLESRRIVLTRDTAGAVHGFSATCTHQGCTVAEVSRGQIACPCHGSRFDASTGAVVHGPATSPLRTVAVVVRDEQVFTS